jgi:hypothetical protein
MKFITTILAILAIAVPALADSDLDCQVVAEAINPTEAQATDDWINLTDGSFSTTVADEDEWTAPVDLVAWGLRATVDVAPAGTDTWDIYLVEVATNTTLHCEILGTATSCTDTSFAHRPVIEAGNGLTVVVDSGDGASDPAAAAELTVSFCVSRKR